MSSPRTISLLAAGTEIVCALGGGQNLDPGANLSAEEHKWL